MLDPCLFPCHFFRCGSFWLLQDRFRFAATDAVGFFVAESGYFGLRRVFPGGCSLLCAYFFWFGLYLLVFDGVVFFLKDGLFDLSFLCLAGLEGRNV